MKDVIAEYQKQNLHRAEHVHRQQVDLCSCWVELKRWEMINQKASMTMGKWNCPVIWENMDKKGESKNEMEVHCGQWFTLWSGGVPPAPLLRIQSAYSKYCQQGKILTSFFYIHIVSISCFRNDTYTFKCSHLPEGYKSPRS